MTESDQRITFLRSQFDRFLALPRHKADDQYHQRLNALKRFETAEIRHRHASACNADMNYAAVIDFYLCELHHGLNLQGMVDRGPQGINNARRLDKAYQLFANAIEFSVLSAVIQDEITLRLGKCAVTRDSYAQALHACDDMRDRKRRLELLVDIGKEVEPHINSRLMHTGLKLLRGIFRNSGLADIHKVADEGFIQLRSVSGLAQQLETFADTEISYLTALKPD